MDERILKAVRKRAYGYVSREVTEEYGVDETGEKLVRRRVKTTDVPPDLAALKMLAELSPPERSLSYDEIVKEKERLMREWLSEGEKDNGNST